MLQNPCSLCYKILSVAFFLWSPDGCSMSWFLVGGRREDNRVSVPASLIFQWKTIVFVAFFFYPVECSLHLARQNYVTRLFLLAKETWGVIPGKCFSGANASHLLSDPGGSLETALLVSGYPSPIREGDAQGLMLSQTRHTSIPTIHGAPSPFSCVRPSVSWMLSS